MSLISTPISSVVGEGSAQSDLSPSKLYDILIEALADISPRSSVLAIIADKTRDDNTNILFPLAARILGERKLKKYDALVAQGTHSPMTDREKRVKVGAENSQIPGLGQIFDHEWANPEKLVTIGTLDADKVKEITGGLLDRPIHLTVNRLLSPGQHDTLLVVDTCMR